MIGFGSVAVRAATILSARRTTRLGSGSRKVVRGSVLAVFLTATALACSANDGDFASDSEEVADIGTSDTESDESAFAASNCPYPAVPTSGLPVCLRVRQTIHTRGGGRDVRDGVASLGLWKELPTLRRPAVARLCGYAYDPYWHLGDTFEQCRDALDPKRAWLPEGTFNRTGRITARGTHWDYGTSARPATFTPIDGSAAMHLPGYYEQRWIRYFPGGAGQTDKTDRLITSEPVGGPYWCNDVGNIMPRTNAGGWLVPIALAGTATAAFSQVQFGAAIPGGTVVMIGAVVVGGVSYGVLSTADWIRSHPGGIQGRLDAIAAAANGTVCTRMQPGSVQPVSSIWVSTLISAAGEQPGCKKSEPGQTCCDETRTYLGWLMHQTCDNNGPLGCAGTGLACNEYTRRYTIGAQCADLRKAVNRECFGNKPYNPNDSHWAEIQRRVEAANRCRDRLMTRPPTRPKEMPTCVGNVPQIQLYP
jgi:hypothetical protein